jgi:hypothetical protein
MKNIPRNIPPKDNSIEPVMSPLRLNINDKNFLTEFISWRLERRHFRMREDWCVWVEHLQLWVKIPKGFVFDCASVPKAFHSFINSIDALFYGSILHDFIYRTGQLIVCTDDNYGVWYLKNNINKSEADKIMFKFSSQMESLEVPNTIAVTVLFGAGWFAWNSSRKLGLTLRTAYPSETNSVLTHYN